MAESESLASNNPGKTWADTRRGRVVIIVGMLGLFVLVFWLAMKSRQLLAEPVPLAVSEEYLNFGEVWEENNFHWRIPIKNTTKEDIKIAKFAKSCNCSSVEPSSLVVQANTSAEVLLILDLTKRKTSTRLETREFDVMITPLVSGKVIGNGWKVRGRVREAFAFDSSIIQFEPYYFAGNPVAPKVVNLTIHAGLKDVRVACEPDIAQVTLRPVAKAQNRVEVEIAPNKSLRPGIWRGQIAAQATTHEARILTSDRIPVVIEVLDEIQIAPETLFLGILPEGTREERMLTFQSLSGGAFSVVGVEKSRTDIEITPIQRASGEQLKLFRIGRQVRDLGFQECTITFSIRSKKGRIIKFPITVTWHGIEREKPM